MMDGPAVFAEAQADTDDYLLDLSADPGVDDFDFKLDGVYDNGMVDTSMEASGGADPSTGPEFKIEYEHKETHTIVAEEEHAEATEEVQDAGAGASTEYQDEIGYEDDESALPDATNVTAEETIALDPDQPSGLHDDVYAPQDGSGHQDQAEGGELDAPDSQEADALDGELQQEDGGGQDEDHVFEDNAEGGQSTVESAEASAHQSPTEHGRTPASNPEDFEYADSAASDISSILPDIVVHYNQGQYSLLGAPTDDPDTYFFSDEKDLDGSLSHLLASIRTVLSDEVAAGDELSIRIESLDFEFGEKSSKKFLDRPFRDILTCFGALAANSKLPPKDSSTLNLALMVRRDCEDHFLELLADAGLVEEDHTQSPQPQDEDIDDHSTGGQAHDESSVDEVPEEYNLGPDTTGAVSNDEASVVQDEEEVDVYFSGAFEDFDDTMGEAFDLEMGMPGPGEQNGIGASDQQSTEVRHDEDKPESHDGVDFTGHEERAREEGLGDDDVDLSAGFEGEFTADPTNEGSELAAEASNQAAAEAGKNDWYEEAAMGDDVGVEEVNATNVVGATTEQGSTTNDVDFVISLDPESGLSTIHQQHADVDIVHDVDLGQAPVENLHFIASTSNGAGSASNQTSRTSTIIGDEVETQDYPLEQPTFDDLQTGAESQGDRDEIDWENDGDDNEEQPQLAPHTTNSPTGKRTRTNEPESLDEEADYKRRRT